MLWYGLFFYVCLLFIASVIFLLVFRFKYSYSLEKLNAGSIFSFLTLKVTLLFCFFALAISYGLLHGTATVTNLLYSTFLFSFAEQTPPLFFTNKALFFETTAPLYYYFPFIYIFILITALSIFFCLSYNQNETAAFSLFSLSILISGAGLFYAKSFILFFFFYEMLLLPSFFILYKFAKTRRCIEAAYLMFFWTQFGALFLIFSFLYLFAVTSSTSFSNSEEFCFSTFEVNFLFICWFVGFGVKLPIWPFYGWLPKAHVEASTNFSIFLSGVLVKFAFFGFLKCLLTLRLEPTFIYAYPFLILGMVDSIFKLFYQIDLKKLVAYSTVVEMHWLTFCIVSGQSGLFLSGFCMLISHALMSTNSFLLVDAVNRRFKTRLITEIGGLNFICPKLFLAILVNILIFLGFPGSLFFISEILFFTFLLDLFPIAAIFFLVLLYFMGPLFFFRSWMNVMFGATTANFKTLPADLNSKESLVYFGLSFLMFWLGFTWQSFIF